MADEGLLSTGMYNDVLAQPECWERMLRRDVEAWTAAMRSASSGLVIGMGSSHYAALAAQYALWQAGAYWQPVTSDVALHYVPSELRPDTVLAISQSGESADTLKAAARLKDRAGRLVSLTNNPRSSLAGLGDVSLDLGCGEEKGSSTKTYTTSVLTLLLGAYGGAARLHHLPGAAAALLETLSPAQAPELLSGDRRHYFLGTGPNVATALEAALLCKEKLFLHAEGSGAADFVHGPLEAVDERSTIWIFATAARMDDLLLPLARRLAQTGAQLVVIGEEAGRLDTPEIRPAWTCDIDPGGGEELGTLLFILPIQLLVLWETARRGYPVDTFRRMDKVMTGYDYGLG